MPPRVLTALSVCSTFQQGEVGDRIVSALTQHFPVYLNITDFLTSDTLALQNAEFHATAQYVKFLLLENFSWGSSSNESLRDLPSSPLVAQKLLKLSIDKISISVAPLRVQKVRPVKQLNLYEKRQEFKAGSSQKGSVFPLQHVSNGKRDFLNLRKFLVLVPKRFTGDTPFNPKLTDLLNVPH